MLDRELAIPAATASEERLFEFHGRVVPGQLAHHSFGLRVVSDTEVGLWILGGSTVDREWLQPRLDELMQDERDPASILRTLNGDAIRLLPPACFVAAIVVFFDRSTRRLRISSAAGFRPYLFQDGEWRRILDGAETGLLLGILPDVEHFTHVVRFPPGTTLLWISPYSMEARGRDQSLYCLGRFPHTIGTIPEAPLAAVETVIADIEEFRDEKSYFEDLCAVSFRWIDPGPAQATR